MEATLMRGIDAVWPTNAVAPEDKVKRVAALYLLRQPDKEAASSAIADAVARSIGSVEKLGLKKSFKQIMTTDPCFVIEQRHVSEAWFSLNRPLLNPVSAVNALWPAEAADAEIRMWHVAAAFLSDKPSYISTLSHVAAEVGLRLGSTKYLGINKSFKQVIEQQPGYFQLSAEGQQLTLNVQRLLRHSAGAGSSSSGSSSRLTVPQLSRQPLPGKPSSSAAAGSSSSSSDIAAAIAAVWPAAAADPEVHMRRAAALFLSTKPHNTSIRVAVVAAVDSAVGSAKKLNIKKSFDQVLQAEPDAFVLSSNGQLITLDAGRVLRRQQQQQQQAAVRVVPRPGTTRQQQQQQQQSTSNTSSQPAPPSPPPPLAQPPPPAARQQPPLPPVPQQQQQQQPPPPSVPRQQQPPPPAPQQQQSAWQQQPGQPLAVMPLPEGLHALKSLSAVECATAGISIVAEHQQGQLQQVLVHLRAAKLCAVDLEFAQPDAPPVDSSTSTSRGGRAGGRAANRGAHLDRLALLQLFVPATAAAAAASGSSNWQQQQQQRPAAVYIVQVPEEPHAAAEVLTQLQPVLEDATVSKVMHDARWDSCVLQAQFGISLAGVLDTQLLAGLTNLAAGCAGIAAGSSTVDGSSSSSIVTEQWDGYLGRVGLGRLLEACGFPHPTKSTMAQAFDVNPR
jgi:hypothetical protein